VNVGPALLDQDRDGKYALIYTDFKNNRVGRRLLAVSDATAALIIGYLQFAVMVGVVLIAAILVGLGAQ